MVNLTEKEAFSILFKAYNEEMDKQTKTIMSTTQGLAVTGDKLSSEAFAGMYATAVGISTLRAVSKLFKKEETP